MKVSKSVIISNKNNILQYMNSREYCSNEELAKELGLSISTIRRYVQQLEDDGFITRYHGGIMLKQNDTESISNDVYLSRNAKEKNAIMKYVAENLLDNDDTIFINGSSTALFLYPYLNSKQTIITNNARILLSDAINEATIILIGGQPSSHNGNYIMCGDLATHMIDTIYAKTCILGVSGISSDVGLTSASPQDISINRGMLAKTRSKKIIVADHSKIGKTFNFCFASLKGIDYLVTDTLSDPSELERIRSQGVHVITVEVE